MMKNFVTLMILVIVAGFNTYAQTKLSNQKTFSDSLSINDVDHKNGITVFACDHSTIVVDVPGQDRRFIDFKPVAGYKYMNYVYEAAVMFDNGDTLIVAMGSIYSGSVRGIGSVIYALRVYDLDGNMLAHRGFQNFSINDLYAKDGKIVYVGPILGGKSYCGTGEMGSEGVSEIPVDKDGAAVFVFDRYLKNLKIPHLYEKIDYNNPQILSDGKLLTQHESGNFSYFNLLNNENDSVLKVLSLGVGASMAPDIDGTFWLVRPDSVLHLDSNWNTIASGVNDVRGEYRKVRVFDDELVVGMYGFYGRISKDLSSSWFNQDLWFNELRTIARGDDRDKDYFEVFHDFHNSTAYREYLVYSDITHRGIVMKNTGKSEIISFDVQAPVYNVNIVQGDAISVSEHTILGKDGVEIYSGDNSLSTVLHILETTDMESFDPFDYLGGSSTFVKTEILEDLQQDQFGNWYMVLRILFETNSFASSDFVTFRLYFNFVTCHTPDIVDDVSYDTVSKFLMLDTANLGDVDGYDYQWVRGIQGLDEPPYIIVSGANSPYYKPTESGTYALVINLRGSPWCTSLSNFVPVTVKNIGIKTISSSSIKVYPNPTTGQDIHIETPFQIKSAEVLSTTGQSIINVYKVNTVPTASLAPGMYILRVTSHDGLVGIQRFIRN